MDYVTLLVVLASMSLFFILQAIYWILKSRRDRKSALLDQRLGRSDHEQDFDGLAREEVEGDWAMRMSILLRAAGESSDINMFIQKILIYASVIFLLGLVMTQNITVAIFLGLGGAYLPYARLIGKREKRMRFGSSTFRPGWDDRATV